MCTAAETSKSLRPAALSFPVSPETENKDFSARKPKERTKEYENRKSTIGLWLAQKASMYHLYARHICYPQISTGIQDIYSPQKEIPVKISESGFF